MTTLKHYSILFLPRLAHHNEIAMKSILKIIIISVASLLNGCTNIQSKYQSVGYFNEAAFTGLVTLPKTGTNIHLDYDLTKPSGENLHITSCKQVKAFTDTSIDIREYSLQRLLTLNCMAAEEFLLGQDATTSFFTEQSLVNIISNLPAMAVPDLGGDGLSAKREGRILIDYEKLLNPTASSPTEVKVELENKMMASYTLMAKKDLNNDGIEDLVLLIGWRIIDTFGKGKTLIAVSKTSENSPIEILWRRY